MTCLVPRKPRRGRGRAGYETTRPAATRASASALRRGSVRLSLATPDRQASVARVRAGRGWNPVRLALHGSVCGRLRLARPTRSQEPPGSGRAGRATPHPPTARARPARSSTQRPVDCSEIIPNAILALSSPERLPAPKNAPATLPESGPVALRVLGPVCGSAPRLPLARSPLAAPIFSPSKPRPMLGLTRG